MSRRMAYRLIGVALVLMLLVGGWYWLTPKGTGEFRTSPDGRFTARASNMSTASPFGSPRRYIKIEVVEASSGREVWRIVHRFSAEADLTDVPDYGSQAEKFLLWSADSSSVTVPVDGGRRLVLNVP